MIKSKQILKPRLVLVVDDQEINRDSFGAILDDEYEEIYAENGQEALEMIEEHADDLSIVMLDLVQGYYFSRPLPAEEFERLIVREIETERG